jgi:transposase
MGTKKDLTDAQKAAIIYGYKNKDSYRTIAAQVGCKKSVVGLVVNRFLKTGSTVSRAKRTGRSSTVDRDILKKLAIENRRLCVAKLNSLYNHKTKKKVSEKTIRRALHREELKSCIPRKKPLISSDNIAKRLAWCRDREKWTVKDFKRILWSDESTFTQFQQARNCRVWREPSEEWDLDCLVATVKHSPSRMHWGVFPGLELALLFRCINR